jgi:hypothetical protein
MKKRTKNAMRIGLQLIYLYNFAILAGTAFLVACEGWSPWWFLLAIGLMASK